MEEFTGGIGVAVVSAILGSGSEVVAELFVRCIAVRSSVKEGGNSVNSRSLKSRCEFGFVVDLIQMVVA